MKPLALQLLELYEALSTPAFDLSQNMIRTIVAVQKRAVEGNVNKHSLNEAIDYLMQAADTAGEVRSWSSFCGPKAIEVYCTSMDGHCYSFDVVSKASAKEVVPAEVLVQHTPMFTYDNTVSTFSFDIDWNSIDEILQSLEQIEQADYNQQFQISEDQYSFLFDMEPTYWQSWQEFDNTAYWTEPTI